MDAHGNVVRHQPVPIPFYETLDVQIQPTGALTFGCARNPATGIDGTGRFYVLDSATWQIKDSLYCSKPYKTDVHELRMFKNGGYALLGTSDTLMARKDWLHGSIDPKPVHIIGNTVEIFDASKNSIFLWRGIDHYGIMDVDTTSRQIKTTDTNFDFQHANSIDFDRDGNILLSNRHLCEVSLIDRTTGNFLWRLGGKHNQFKLLNDSIWFSYQHCARFLTNGHLMLFDNAQIDSIEGSGVKRWATRAVEYELDTAAKTAKLVWEFRHTPDLQSRAMGSVDRLPNGNTVIGWGFTIPGDSITMSEVHPDKSTALEIAIPQLTPDYCYRFTKVVREPMSVAVANDIQHHVWIAIESGSRFVIHSPDESVEVSIYDVLGRRLFVSHSQGSLSFDASNLPHGTYFSHVQGRDWHSVESLKMAQKRSETVIFVRRHDFSSDMDEVQCSSKPLLRTTSL
jgi:hypothetical protein